MIRQKAKYGRKVFISGKVSGLDYIEACRQFYDASKLVLARDLYPVVPVELCRSHWGWYRCMAVCLWHLLRCKYILQLDNWTDSRGAKWEARFARALGKRFLKIENGKIVGL
jgi:hypothetical protein